MGAMKLHRCKGWRAAALSAALLVACGMGPAWPERDGRAWLERRGYEAQWVERVVRGEAIDDALAAELLRRGSDDVRFLVARNGSLSRERMDALSRDRDDFVRSGLARNPQLPPELFERLLDDESHTVWTGLAANPWLDARSLLRVREETGVDWMFFAANPNLPPEVEHALRASGDARAVEYLEKFRARRSQAR